MWIPPVDMRRGIIRFLLILVVMQRPWLWSCYRLQWNSTRCSLCWIFYKWTELLTASRKSYSSKEHRHRTGPYSQSHNILIEVYVTTKWHVHEKSLFKTCFEPSLSESSTPISYFTTENLFTWWYLGLDFLRFLALSLARYHSSL